VLLKVAAMSGHTCFPIIFFAPKKRLCGTFPSFSHFFHENKTAICSYPKFEGIDELLMLPHLLIGLSYPHSLDEPHRFPSRSIVCFLSSLRVLFCTIPRALPRKI
jgi:hypothetical protein